MAAGDLIAANMADLDGELCYQAELDGYLLGDGAPWVITAFSGLGGARNAGDRVQGQFSPTVASGVHVAQPGGVVLTAISSGCSSAAEMEEAIAEVEAAWTITTPTHVPLALHLLVPRRGHVSVLGWPDEVDPTRVFAAGGVATVVCSFSRVDVTVTAHGGS